MSVVCKPPDIAEDGSKRGCPCGTKRRVNPAHPAKDFMRDLTPNHSGGSFQVVSEGEEVLRDCDILK